MPSKWQFAALANYRNIIREGAVNKLMWDFVLTLFEEGIARLL